MELKIEGNVINYTANKDGKLYDCKTISNSWKENLNYNYIDEKLRNPQKGALYALKSHFTTSNNEATIVMPTGTGKTETMLIYIVSECLNKVLVIVPSSLLREQTFNKCKTMGLIKEFGILEEKMPYRLMSQ